MATSSYGPLDGCLLENFEFMIPRKEILKPDDIANKWEKSEAYRDLVGFMQIANDAVKGLKITDDFPTSHTADQLLVLIQTVGDWIAGIPPIQQPQRFGNKAFTEWHKKLETTAEDILRDALDQKFHRAVPEIATYLKDSFGNPIRIDYGTGHEMAFITFMCCIFKIGALSQADLPAIVLRIFYRYLQLTHRLQETYRMEPAGSHGVWSLDDYQFIPFYWGSAQLIDHPRLKPKSFPDRDICDAYANDYIFFNAVQYIHKVKTGPFAEHSNQLWNISGVPQWTKVNSGLFKMYKNEVLCKFPVIQHCLFGSLMSIKSAE